MNIAQGCSYLRDIFINYSLCMEWKKYTFSNTAYHSYISFYELNGNCQFSNNTRFVFSHFLLCLYADISAIFFACFVGSLLASRLSWSRIFNSFGYGFSVRYFFCFLPRSLTFLHSCQRFLIATLCVRHELASFARMTPCFVTVCVCIGGCFGCWGCHTAR